jgi:hypothetical protein
MREDRCAAARDFDNGTESNLLMRCSAHSTRTKRADALPILLPVVTGGVNPPAAKTERVQLRRVLGQLDAVDVLGLRPINWIRACGAPASRGLARPHHKRDRDHYNERGERHQPIEFNATTPPSRMKIALHRDAPSLKLKAEMLHKVVRHPDPYALPCQIRAVCVVEKAIAPGVFALVRCTENVVTIAHTRSDDQAVAPLADQRPDDLL